MKHRKGMLYDNNPAVTDAPGDVRMTAPSAAIEDKAAVLTTLMDNLSNF